MMISRNSFSRGSASLNLALPAFFLYGVLSCTDAQPLPAQSGSPADVQFVVGDYMVSEGGQWKPSDSPLDGPFGIDVDSQGNLWMVELESGRLHQLTRTGGLKTLRDAHEKGFSGDGGHVAQAQFNGPHNVVVGPDDQILVSDSWNHCVRRIDPRTGQVDTLVGTGDEGFSGDGGDGKKATFHFVMCISLDASRKTMHIADLKNRRVRNVDLESGMVRTVAGNGKKGVPDDGSLAADSPLVDPRAVASDANGNLYILERGGHALRVVRKDGRIETVAGTGKQGYRDGDALQAQFGAPKHICCDELGNVYIADDANRAIRKYDPQLATVTTVLGRGFGDKKITLKRPHGVRWHDGTLYVVDTGNNRILAYRQNFPTVR